MFALRHIGKAPEAKAKAKRLIDSLDKDELAISRMDKGDQLDIASWRAQAHAILGQTEEAKRYAMQVEDGDSRLDALMTWASIDPVHARELFEAFDESYQERYLGRIVLFYLEHYPLLQDPKMQAAIVKDGRWLDYLAERMPEYAQYKSKP